MPRPKRWPNQVVWSVSDEALAAVRKTAHDLGESESGAARLILDAGIARLKELDED